MKLLKYFVSNCVRKSVETVASCRSEYPMMGSQQALLEIEKYKQNETKQHDIIRIPEEYILYIL